MTGHVIRPARVDDLAECAAIWRESLNDYLGRLAQPEIPDDLGPILRLYGHLLATELMDLLGRVTSLHESSSDVSAAPSSRHPRAPRCR